VVDAGQHDQRTDRIDIVGDRQEDGDRGQRADARQNADKGSDKTAQQAQQKILEGKGDGETEGEMIQQLPGHYLASGPLTGARPFRKYRASTAAIAMKPSADRRAGQ